MLILKNQRIHIRKFKDLELPAAVKAPFNDSSGNPDTNFPTVTSVQLPAAKDSSPKEKIPYICGLRARIECEPFSEHSTRSDRVTNIGYLLFGGASRLARQISILTLEQRYRTHDEYYTLEQANKDKCSLYRIDSPCNNKCTGSRSED